MRLSLIVLALSWVLLFSIPAMAQTDPSTGNAQYDQYEVPEGGAGPDDGVGDRAARDAITAWGAIRAGSADAQDGGADVASASEASDEEATDPEDESPDADASGPEDESPDADASGPEELPDTGGPSPLWFLIPMLCAGGFLARGIHHKLIADS